VSTPIIPMLLWQGNVAGLVLLGFVGLPLMLPYLLLQPNLAIWAIVARRNWILWAAVFGIATLLIWGLWPPEFLQRAVGRATHPIAAGWQILGLPVLLIGLVMLVFTNADPLRLIAVGSFLTPYLMPVHLVVLLPALGRVQGIKRIIIWLCAWLTLLPPMFTTRESKWVMMIFPFVVWWLLRPQPVPVKEESPSIVLSASPN
jgi:hypothetical protein